MAGRAQDMEQDEKPLDPAAERLRQRLVRFLAINLGILFFAVLVVIGAVIYRAGFFGKSTPEAPVAEIAANGEIAVPAGADILSQSLSGDRLSLHIRREGADAILIFDLGSGRQIGRYEVRRSLP
ncbi:MAG: fimbrial protein [Mesorhizobium sp.]